MRRWILAPPLLGTLALLAACSGPSSNSRQIRDLRATIAAQQDQLQRGAKTPELRQFTPASHIVAPPTGTTEVDECSVCLGLAVRSQGNIHVNPGDNHVAYSTDPPASGPHFPTVPTRGIYTTPFVTEYLPHFLEHGGAEVQYNKSAPRDVIQELTDIVNKELDRGVGQVLLAPRPDMPCEVSLTSWGRILTFGAAGCQPGSVGHTFDSKSAKDASLVTDFVERNQCAYDPENQCGGGFHGETIFPTAKPGEVTVQATLGTATPSSPTASPTQGVRSFSAAPPFTIDVTASYTAIIHTSAGDVTIKLDPWAAPQTVNNFVFLVQNHFYDGLRFDRVMPGFIAHAGAPNPDGSGGPGYTIPDEPSPLKHDFGSVATAQSSLSTSWVRMLASD